MEPRAAQRHDEPRERGVGRIAARRDHEDIGARQERRAVVGQELAVAQRVREDDIHFEAFGPASVRPTGSVSNEPAVASSASVDVRFSRAGRTLVWDGQDANLLDFAERHGIAVESGCRSGGCGSCETRVLAGSVSYESPPDHEPAAGHCLLCVGRPASPLVLEA